MEPHEQIKLVQRILNDDSTKEKIHNLETDVALLKRNIEIQTMILDRLDKTVESLHDLAETMHRMVAVHEEKFNSQEKINTQVTEGLNSVLNQNKKVCLPEKKEGFNFSGALNAFLNVKTMLYAAAFIVAFFAHKIPDVLNNVFNK